jgi:diguanylate cyclase (GGDEF)-like protein
MLSGLVAGSDELLIGQYQALRRQIPLMYVLMFIDAAFLGCATFGEVPLAQSIGVPAILLVVTIGRSAVWMRRRQTTPPPESIRRYLRSTIIVAAVLSSGFGSWGLLLLDAANPVQMFAVALYIFVGAITCCYCLQPLPAAGRLVLIFGAMPVTVRLILSDDWYLFGVAANFIIVAALVARTLSTNHRGFIEVINSRSDMLAEQARARVAEQQAQRLAYHDALTGLPNRRALTEHLDGLRLPSGTGAIAALLLLDLDLFKAVNDVHGHPAGDRLLKRVAQRLTEVVCDVGTAYRLGGDEFAVTLELTGADRGAAIVTAQRIVDGLADPFRIEGLTHHIGASVGVSFFPDDAVDSETLMRRADIALYRAKALGRSRQLAFEPGMDAEITRRSSLERDLRRDLTRGAFHPWYQPIVNLSSGKLTGFEMLAQWHRTDNLHVGPDQFIPIAEECGLVGDLMLDLLQQACAGASEWGPDLILSINVSPTQLKDRSLSEKILGVLAATGFPATRLKLEITENALISEPENAKGMVSLLKSRGVRLALDDFGTGYSSIQHLRLLPFDNIKIDQSFILGLEGDEDAHRMVQAMVRLATSLDLPVTAEGIESHAVLEVLRGMGCAEGQGYLFGKPMETAGVAELLGRQRFRASHSLAA